MKNKKKVLFRVRLYKNIYCICNYNLIIFYYGGFRTLNKKAQRKKKNDRWEPQTDIYPEKFIYDMEKIKILPSHIIV